MKTGSPRSWKTSTESCNEVSSPPPKRTPKHETCQKNKLIVWPTPRAIKDNANNLNMDRLGFNNNNQNTLK